MTSRLNTAVDALTENAINTAAKYKHDLATMALYFRASESDQ